MTCKTARTAELPTSQPSSSDICLWPCGTWAFHYNLDCHESLGEGYRVVAHGTNEGRALVGV